MKKKDVVNHILAGRTFAPVKTSGTAFAAANIALCKYWGKRNEELNLPVTPSLSVSLDSLGTTSTVTLRGEADEIILNGTVQPPRSGFARGASAFLNVFRPAPDAFFRLDTVNTVPTAAGLASSASGFAALVLALNDLCGWDLPPRSLSILARLGSGSACRSIFSGFVEWFAGADADGMDSFAEPLAETWPDLRLGLLTLSDAPKAISSRDAMKRTRRTSALYEAWPVKVQHDLALLREAIRDGDFGRFGQIAESNALSMHATSLGAWPPVLFWLPESVAAMHRIWALREEGLHLYFTMDAGPNVKLLFLAEDAARVEKLFPGVRIVAPFANA